MIDFVYVPLIQKDSISLYARARVHRRSPQVEEGHGFHVVDDGLSIELDCLDLYISDSQKPIPLHDLLNKDQVSYIEKLIIEKL
jgi:hypothetical protein